MISYKKKDFFTETMTHKNVKLRPKIALYEPDIPQNTAAIIRTCSCLGADLEIIEPCGFLLSDKRFRRVVMDYIDEKSIKLYNNYNDFFIAKKNKRVILMTTKGSKFYNNFKFRIDDTILFGRESAGVPEKIHNLVSEKLKIPMMNNKRSLNISTSAAIVLSESLRQNKFINHE
jgi:tRNA (cytidine/uridine-2'-O-)-methyltransferase